jgi:dTDP-4-dehydrorhamnose 3,5-epimerase
MSGSQVEVVDFEIRPEVIAGLFVVTPKQVSDGRGTVREVFRRSAFEAAGIELDVFRQINLTESHRGVIRGMHAEEMTKLLTVASGRAFGAYVDLRPDSATVGDVVTVDLEPGVQVLVPAGVANGFQALTDDCQYAYCFDEEWRPDMPGRSCNPFGSGVEWPIPVDPDDRSKVSAKDAEAPTLRALMADRGAGR